MGYWDHPQWHKLRELDENKKNEDKPKILDPNDWTQYLPSPEITDTL